MRSRTDSRSGKATPAPLEKHFREIVVGSGRSQEPYIIAFHYASDNISGSTLGTLFGFFEVEIHDQDAAYIVNFLASVAKKEYFANPRRNPIESFETTLHKINVALAEVVKHGNISWLGHLHGALGAVNRNMLNFSVTGDGKIYLGRGETLSSVSEGLADTDGEPHPLKTFTDVSSGELFDGDLVFAFSPSIWSLFSPEDLQRSLNRLGPIGFERFLHTALINEVPTAAVALVTCSAPAELPTPEKSKVPPKKTISSLENVWSETPFSAAREAKLSIEVTAAVTSAEAEPEEYTDRKTGHIYVQASPDEIFEPASSRWKERWILLQHELRTKLYSWGVSTRKTSRRMSRESALALATFGAQLSLVKRSLGRKTRTIQRTVKVYWRTFRDKQGQKKVLEEIPTVPGSYSPSAESHPVAKPVLDTPHLIPSPEIVLATTPGVSGEKTMRDTLLTRWMNRCRLIFTRILNQSRRSMRVLRRRGTLSWRWLTGFWQTLSPKEKWSIVGMAGIIIFIGGIAAMRDTEEPSVTQEVQLKTEESETPPVFPPASEPLATILSGHRLLFPTNNSRSIVLATINKTVFVVTERAIVNLATQESVTTPEPLRLATGMDDLDAIFAIGESGTLYLWSAVTKKFEQNTLPLPVGAEVSAIGSYLTYLYVLDQNMGVIYRFPRAEGGFGGATTWSKESISANTATPFAVYENIVVANTSGKPVLYTKGRDTGIDFSGPITPVTIDVLALSTQSGDIFALDRNAKRILRWSATGTLIGQYYQESFGAVETFSISPDGLEILVSQQGATTAWQIP